MNLLKLYHVFSFRNNIGMNNQKIINSTLRNILFYTKRSVKHWAMKICEKVSDSKLLKTETWPCVKKLVLITLLFIRNSKIVTRLKILFLKVFGPKMLLFP